jgi:hypothetical protein
MACADVEGMEQRLIYVLTPLAEGLRWSAEMGLRTQDFVRSQDRISVRHSFETRAEAETWLLDCAKAMEVPLLPKKVRPTRVPLPLGGVIPNTT